MASSSSSKTVLPIVRTCHNYPHSLFQSSLTTDEYTPFHLHLDPPTAQIGFLPHSVVDEIRKLDSDVFTTDKEGRIGLSRSLNTFEKRSRELNAVAQQWREAGLFSSALDGWRDEQYAIYSSDRFPFQSWEESDATSPRSPAFELERAACAVLGLTTFGVHLTAYITTTGSDGRTEVKIWVPRRAKDKATWPGYLDNSVAGGITSGDRPWESMIRECWEEAGLEDALVRPSLRQVGVITYVYRTPAGFLQPEVEYVYDLPLPEDVQPRPQDGEAEDFNLMDLKTTRSRMEAGEFKPNCSLVILDFLIRHGEITAENEPRYMEVVSLLHNDLGMPGP